MRLLFEGEGRHEVGIQGDDLHVVVVEGKDEGQDEVVVEGEGLHDVV